MKIWNKVIEIFDNPLYGQIFVARCHDTGEGATIENARLFKDAIAKRKTKDGQGHDLQFNRQTYSKFTKNQLQHHETDILDLHSLRLGVNSISALSGGIIDKSITKLNLSDNCISDFGMHAVNSLLLPNLGSDNHRIHNKEGDHAKITHLNIASNMISSEGIEYILEDLIKNSNLIHLDLGYAKGSLVKNSLGIQGAVCISALLIRNKHLQSLYLDNTDLGSEGGECLGIALGQNQSIKKLKLSENELKSEGAIPIIKSCIKYKSNEDNFNESIESLDLSQNSLKSDTGRYISSLLKLTSTLKQLYLQYNELMVEGCKSIAKGLKINNTLQVLNIKGNI